MNNCTIKKTTHPMTGDTLWIVDDLSLALGGISELVEQFINENYHDDFSLSIYDDGTGKTIEIECRISEMPQLVSRIYHIEHGTPISFIGVNSLTNCYVVGMTISKGRIPFGNYRVENGELMPI